MDRDEDYLSDEEAEVIAESSARFKKQVCDSPVRVVTDPNPYFNNEYFIAAYAYPTSIAILDSEIGFDPIKQERIIVQK